MSPGPAQGRLARVARENIVDGGTARQHAGNDGEQTEHHQTGHDKPIPCAYFSHFCDPHSRE
jgi:hypothetical protein